VLVFLTILHGIIAMALLGAATHQGLSVWRKPALAVVFVDRFRAVPGIRFATAIVVLYVLVFALGAYIYPTYVLDVKGSVIDYGMRKTVGVFQIKEHVSVMGLALLPIYWHFWRTVPLTEGIQARRLLTTFLTVGSWWNLVIGHLLNNLKGLT
jgi:hypothetical protein